MVPFDGTMSAMTITLCIIGIYFVGGVSGIAKSFVNSSMPSMRPTFVVNFDMATVICQHSADSTDLHLHQMSILCDGKTDCFSNPAMHDESFPYCAGKCEPGCTERGACLHDGESAQCYCDSGFHGKRCEMIDNNECADKPCHWLAHCQNTFGSYYCSCFPGFEGNGYECTDIDECESGSSNCPEHSACVNLPGTYFCNCTEGFMPKGLPLERCADIDECDEGLHDCPDTHMCQNEIGSFRCVQRCGPGHDLINGTCADIDECAGKDNGCDRRAICTNTPGSYRCECDVGFEGDGRVCNPMADCSQNEGICDMHAFCVAPLRMCLCQAGYIGDGLSCFDVNECVTANDTCEGQAGTRCVNIDGGYLCCDEDDDDAKCMKDQGAICANRCGLNAQCRNDSCQCIPGFEGDPLTKCTDVNECETRDDTCKGVGQWCVNMFGGHICCGTDSTQSECQGLEISKGRLVTDKPAEQPTTTAPTSSPAETSATSSEAATTNAATTAAPSIPVDEDETKLPVLVETSTAVVGSGTPITVPSAETETSTSAAGVSHSEGDLGGSTTGSATRPLTPGNEVTKQATSDHSTVAAVETTTSSQQSTVLSTTSAESSTAPVTNAQPSTEPPTSAPTSTESPTSSSPASVEQSTSAAAEVTTTPSEAELTTTCGVDSTQSDCQGLEIVKGRSKAADSTTLSPTTISAEDNNTTLAPASSSTAASPANLTESPISSTTEDLTTSEAVTSTTSAEATTLTTTTDVPSTTAEAVSSTLAETTTTTVEATTSVEVTTLPSTESVPSTTTEIIESTTSEATTVPVTEAITTPAAEPITSTTTEATTSTTTEAVTSTSTEAITSTSTEAVTSTTTEAITSTTTEAVTSTTTEAVTSTTTEAVTSSAAPSSAASVTETSIAPTTQSDTKLPVLVESSTAAAGHGSTAVAPESLETTTSSADNVTTSSPITTTCGPDSTQSDCQGLEIVKGVKTTTEAVTVAQTTTAETTNVPETSTVAATTTPAEVSSTSTNEVTTSDSSSSSFGAETTESTATTSSEQSTSELPTSTSTEPAISQEATTSADCGPDSTQSDCQGLEIVKVVRTTTEAMTSEPVSSQSETTTQAAPESTSSAAAESTTAHDPTELPPVVTSSETPNEVTDKLSPSPIPGSPTSEPSLPPVSFDTPHTPGPVTSENGVIKTTLQATEKPLTALPPTSGPDDKEIFNLTTTAIPSTTTQKSSKCRSSDDCGDDALCERRSGVCRCLPGFEGMPPTTPCQDVNECKNDLDDCDSSASCLNFIGGYSCICDIGFRKGEGGACIDINECDERTPCHKHAECRNSAGSYSCSCRPGFTGDGYLCIPLEKRPCNLKEAKKAACGQNRLCLVDGLEVTDCNTCKNGFELINDECIDINECASASTNYCHSNANCSNLLGSYKCTCNAGFRGDGFVCQDIDECDANLCHPLAMCKNSIGSFECRCPDGWSGDGQHSCLHPNDKACENLQSACDREFNTACLTVDDGLGPICECQLGYRYHNGTNKCNDVDECQEGRNGCDPVSAVCINRMGQHTCECTDHFEGIGGVCVDVDECARQVSKCDANAHCINDIGGYECVCAAGYTGNGQTCSPVRGTDKGDECTTEWKDLCRRENKTCLLDDQGDSQCGACIEGHHPIQDRCEAVAGPGDCADPAKNDCHKNAECIDVKQGKHFCVCKVGYIGDGRRCDDVDECFIRSVCDERAVCRNTPGSFICTCPPGFVGDGTQCKGPNCQSDSSLCHVNAECLLDGACKCLPGYEGDGTTSCVALSATTTERATSEASGAATTSSASSAVPSTVRRCSRVEGLFCHEQAICQPDGTCECYDGFEGDGHLSCLPVRAPDDRQNCETKSDLCSIYATCHNGRCRCRIGYTGDGVTCVSLETKVDCSKCHPEAVCTEGVCACKSGYLGNGDTCIPDPNDCFIYPNLCHASASCAAETRRCDCNEGFVGDGTICAKKEQQSCLASPNLCHEDAKCLNGVCQCNEGFQGDGVSCNAAVNSPKSWETIAPPTITTGKACTDGHSCHSQADCVDLEPIGVGHECRCKAGFYGNGTSCEDINECETSVGSVNCHHMAKCVNVIGSFSCVCPGGFTGDGVRTCLPSQLPDHIGVDCEADGMTLVLTDKIDPFNGRIFVREQSDNPFCSRRFNKINDTGPEYRFKVPFAHCNIRKESFDTFAVTVVVQKHPMFITEAADAYDLRCTYPTGTKDVMSHINVSMLATSKSFVVDGHKAACSLTINDADDDSKMSEATVGQMLRLKLAVEPANLYSILPRNCFAVNMESGDTYSLTDQAGCAVDTQLFPEWHRDIPSETYAVFRTFKWPDSSHLRFQCDCSACAGECPKVNCARRRLALFRRRFRYRYIRSPSTSSPYHAFSNVLTVDDGEEETRAQRQLEMWMAADDRLWTSSNSELADAVPTSEEEVCLTAPWVGATVGLAGVCAIICAGIITILFCRRRRTAAVEDSTISSSSLF